MQMEFNKSLKNAVFVRGMASLSGENGPLGKRHTR